MAKLHLNPDQEAPQIDLSFSPKAQSLLRMPWALLDSLRGSGEVLQPSVAQPFADWTYIDPSHSRFCFQAWAAGLRTTSFLPIPESAPSVLGPHLPLQSPGLSANNMASSFTEKIKEENFHLLPLQLPLSWRLHTLPCLPPSPMGGMFSLPCAPGFQPSCLPKRIAVARFPLSAGHSSTSCTGFFLR